MKKSTKVSFWFLMFWIILLGIAQAQTVKRERKISHKFNFCINPDNAGFLKFCIDTKGTPYMNATLLKFPSPVGTVTASYSMSYPESYLPELRAPDNIFVEIMHKGELYIYEVFHGKKLTIRIKGEIIETIEDNKVRIELTDDSQLQINFSAKALDCSDTQNLAINPIGYLTKGAVLEDVKNLFGEPDAVTKIDRTWPRSDWQKLSYKYRGETIIDFSIDIDDGKVREITLYNTDYTDNFFESKHIAECLSQFLGNSRKEIEQDLPSGIENATIKTNEEEALCYRSGSTSSGLVCLRFHSSFETDYICNQITVEW